ncbi:hypothetical protein ACWCQN_44190 [Streptomyces sp. NPDC001984]|uniref:hypothetical protein n=1 Tax=Streptomyces sp. NPDC002619 TaxID=3364655 RepID=UPI0036D00083
MWIWIRSSRSELLDLTPIWDQTHLLHALCEYEAFHNEHGTHRALAGAAPLRPLPEMTTYVGASEAEEKSPDLLNSCVWALTDLFLDTNVPGSAMAAEDLRLRARR